MDMLAVFHSLSKELDYQGFTSSINSGGSTYVQPIHGRYILLNSRIGLSAKLEEGRRGDYSIFVSYSQKDDSVQVFLSSTKGGPLFTVSYKVTEFRVKGDLVNTLSRAISLLLSMV